MLVFEPRIFHDERGFFVQAWHETLYREAGLDVRFVQDNQSYSIPNVLRGLHIQHPNGQGKLVSVTAGAVYDVAVDVRHGSPTFGKHVAVVLTAEKRNQLYIPLGFAHGFCVLGEGATLTYKLTDFYSQPSEFGVRWDDPDLGIPWPLHNPIVSSKDLSYPCLKDIPTDRLPPYKAP